MGLLVDCNISFSNFLGLTLRPSVERPMKEGHDQSLLLRYNQPKRHTEHGRFPEAARFLASIIPVVGGKNDA